MASLVGMPAKKEKSLERFASNSVILSAWSGGRHGSIFASERRGINSNGFKDFHLKDKVWGFGATQPFGWGGGRTLARVRPMSSRPSIRHFLRNASTSNAIELPALEF